MTVVTGKIEPLKRIRKILNENGINRLNSIGEIRSFLEGYSVEKQEVPGSAKKYIDDSINALDENLRHITHRCNSSVLFKIIYFLRLKYLIFRRSFYEKNYERILSKRCKQLDEELDRTKEIVDGLPTLIAGAVGETQVVNELKRLPNTYYLFNDFSMKFKPPIFYSEQKTRIFSIQVDHLLIGRSGVFVIETKNWSRKSVESFDLRSPVDQIRRTGYALFVLLHSEKSVNLNKHHWGSKKIPVRNLVAMTNEKPNEEFEHVKVLSLSKLNGYIEYFPKTLSDSEVGEIFNYLGGKINNIT